MKDKLRLYIEENLSINTFKTNNVTDMFSMFDKCSSLTNLKYNFKGLNTPLSLLNNSWSIKPAFNYLVIFATFFS